MKKIKFISNLNKLTSADKLHIVQYNRYIKSEIRGSTIRGYCTVWIIYNCFTVVINQSKTKQSD